MSYKSEPPGHRIAVCLAGGAHTLSHPRVVSGMLSHLLQPNVDVFAAISIDPQLVAGDRDSSAHLQTRAGVVSALERIGAVDYLLYDR